MLTCTTLSIVSNSYSRRAGTRVPLFISGTQQTEVVATSIVITTGVGNLRLSQRMYYFHIHWEEEIVYKLVCACVGGGGVEGEGEEEKEEREGTESRERSFPLHTIFH